MLHEGIIGQHALHLERTHALVAICTVRMRRKGRKWKTLRCVGCGTVRSASTACIHSTVRRFKAYVLLDVCTIRLLGWACNYARQGQAFSNSHCCLMTPIQRPYHINVYAQKCRCMQGMHGSDYCNMARMEHNMTWQNGQPIASK